MALTLLTGPAGSGKTGMVLERFTASLESEPVLVVPTVADVERFEDELLARRPIVLGGRIVTFDRLFGLVAAMSGGGSAPALSGAQRRAVVAAAVRDATLQALAEPARRAGFVEALDRFIAEAQAALVGPATLAARLVEAHPGGSSNRRLQELVSLYRCYLDRRHALDRADAGSLAESAIATLSAKPGAWAGGPVLVHGFDDLTPVQLALLGALAKATEVLASVLHEPGRECLAARERLVERLGRLSARRPGGAMEEPEQLRLLGEEASAGQLSEADAFGAQVQLPPPLGSGLLAHLERAFMTDAPSRHPPSDELRLLEAAGVRTQVEQVAAAIARLMRSGTAADRIAVIVRSPEESASLVEEVFGRFGIPTAVHGERRLSETAVGRGLIALVRAALLTRTAADLVSFLRSPARAPARQVDLLERSVRVDKIESCEEALGRWSELGGRRLWELEALANHGGSAFPVLLERLATIARDLAEAPYRRRAAAPPEREAAELVTADLVAAALAEIADLGAGDQALVPDAAALLALLETLRLPRPARGVAGRVEVMSPYRARARQFSYVFVLSLQDGEFPRRPGPDPFLAEAERRAAGLPAPVDQRDEERYLFYVCLTRATRRVYLCFRSTDDDGRAVSRSFFVDEVLDLLSPGAEGELTERRNLSATVFEAAEAPTERELARALAERRLVEPPPALEASSVLAARLRPALGRARERADRLPGGLRSAFVLEQFAAKKLIGASSLETQAECSFRYFVDHELGPAELSPTAEPLTRGAITHRVLERLYADYRGRRIDPDDLEAALERARTLLAEEARGTSIDPRRATAQPAYRRIESDIARFVSDDAAAGGADIFEVEASFGDGDNDQRPPLPLDGFALHGKIDRIDLVSPGRALIRDYKTGSTVASRKKIAEEKRLQLPLYMLAVRELWGLEPVGGVYHPLGKQHDAVPRGLLRGPKESSPLGQRLVTTDYTADEEEFEGALSEARRDAARLAARIHAGHLARDPLGGSCPRHCDFHPICRRERGDKNPESEAGERQENGDG